MAEDGLTEAPEAVVCAVHVRPLIASEVQEGCAESLVVTPESPQVTEQLVSPHIWLEVMLLFTPFPLAAHTVVSLADRFWPPQLHI